MPAQKLPRAFSWQALCLFLALFQLHLASPLQAQVFEESYFAARYPKRTGVIKGFLKSPQSLLLHATTPFYSPYPAEYLAAINPEGQTIWNFTNPVINRRVSDA